MPLFFVEHRHRDETCPASNPEMARGLANHVTPANAESFGVQVHSDCVLPGEHTLLMVIEAEEAAQVASFATAFMNVGPTTIRPAITCEIVADRAQD